MRNTYTAEVIGATAGPDSLKLVTNRNLVLGHLRAVWWSQWRDGVRFGGPAQKL